MQLNRLKRLPKTSVDILNIVIWGLIAGIGAVFYQISITFFFNHTIKKFSSHSFLLFSIESFGVIVITSLVSGILMTRFCKDAAGSGIPQLKIAYWKDLGFVPFKAIWVKFIAGVLSVGGGGSLGREGPSVFISGGLASSISGKMGFAKQKRRAAASAGAAAGLAAAFNTPLAAITFVLEEMIGTINSRYVGGIFLASVFGAFSVYAIVGRQPAFMLPDISWPSWWSYILIIPVSILAGSTGVLFQRITLLSRKRIRSFSKIPDWVKPAVGGAITWALAMTVFYFSGKIGVFGLGYDDLSDGLTNGIKWHTAGLLLLGKLPATIFAYSFGGCGGIFSPLLFLGAMSGFLIGGLAGIFLPLNQTDMIILAAAGMSACFGAVVKAPLTSILMLFEMTHKFTMVPALMISVFLSQMISRTFCKRNFYDSILEQDGHNLVKIIPPQNLTAWHAMPIKNIFNPKPVFAEDLSAATLQKLLNSYQYKRFPVVKNGKLQGILSRKAAEEAIKNHIEPELINAPVCSSGLTIGETEKTFMESTIGMLVLKDTDSNIEGILTIHDILRAQAAAVE
jgi:CIC family chloride channel protein